jgi:hypothetical protein
LGLGLGFILALAGAEPAGTNRTTVLVVVGAAGEDEFGREFAGWAERWSEACRKADAEVVTVGLGTNHAVPPRDHLEKALKEQPKDGQAELWLVLIGHGTFDGKEAKFNLRGLDVSATELAKWLEPFRRPLAVIDTTSASAPFLTRLSRPGRVVITATRSGSEQNFTRLGRYLSESVADLQADLDKDGQVSLLEAFLTASTRVAEFYEAEGRLATEHALLDDNGDGLGTPANWFRGVRAVKKAKDDASPDGLRAHQFHLIRSDADRQMPPQVRARRDALEMTIARLREAKNKMDEASYYRSLEALLLEMAHLYQEGEGRQPSSHKE